MLFELAIQSNASFYLSSYENVIDLTKLMLPDVWTSMSPKIEQALNGNTGVIDNEDFHLVKNCAKRAFAIIIDLAILLAN